MPRRTVTAQYDYVFIAGSGAPKDKDGNPTDMDLSLDMLRILTMLDRAGNFGD